jgi:2-keto-4-pentenoate hydratase
MIKLLAREVLDRYDSKDPFYPMFDDSKPEFRTHDSSYAYAVQREVANLRISRGEVCCGFKLGMTSPKISAQMGFSGPVRGYLWDTECYQSGSRINRVERFYNVGLEAEVAVILRSAVSSGNSGKLH